MKCLERIKQNLLQPQIKKRVEDDKLFKFLSIMDKGIVYQVGLSLNRITDF